MLSLLSSLAVAAPPDPSPPPEDPEQRWTARIVTGESGLLLGATAIHFAAIPLLRNTVHDWSPTQRSFDLVWSPLLLDHVVAGTLLGSTALTELYLAPALRRGERWAWTVSIIGASAVMLLPVELAAVMGPQYFSAVPFATAAALVTASGLTLIVPLVAFHGHFGER